MTDGIDPTRLRRDTGYVESTEPAPAHRRASQPLPELTDLPEASFGPLAHVRKDVSVQRTADPPKTPVQLRLDAFLQSATPEYTVDGKSVRVPIPFRMTVDVRKPPVDDQWRRQEEKVVVPHSGELKAAAVSVGLGDARHLTLLRSGRATPEDVQKVTQALIDRGRLPSASNGLPDAASRVRRMMFDYGIGIDCAGYTQQAYLESRGLSRGQTKLNPNIANEDLTNLTYEGFQKVQIDEARTGDILVLDPPPNTRAPGHTLIVYARISAALGDANRLVVQHDHACAVCGGDMIVVDGH